MSIFKINAKMPTHMDDTCAMPMTCTFRKWLSFQSGCHGNQAGPLSSQNRKKCNSKTNSRSTFKVGTVVHKNRNLIRTMRTKPWGAGFLIRLPRQPTNCLKYPRVSVLTIQMYRKRSKKHLRPFATSLFKSTIIWNKVHLISICFDVRT